jgi:hypothetical protein
MGLMYQADDQRLMEVAEEVRWSRYVENHDVAPFRYLWLLYSVSSWSISTVYEFFSPGDIRILSHRSYVHCPVAQETAGN